MMLSGWDSDHFVGDDFVTTVKLEAAGRTHVGMKRSLNEAVFVVPR